MIGLAPQDRPREKLAEQGKAALGDNELLAVLLGLGAPGITSLDLANRLLADLGGLRGLARVSPVELSRRRGVGPATASREQSPPFRNYPLSTVSANARSPCARGATRFFGNGCALSAALTRRRGRPSGA